MITAPTLVISGRADGLNPPEAGYELAQGIPGAHFQVYEESGHMLTAEEQDRLVTDVFTFAGDRDEAPDADRWKDPASGGRPRPVR